MTTSNLNTLLMVALQDLREGREAIVERLPDIASATCDPAVRSAFDRLVIRSREEAAKMADMLDDPQGEPNLWAAGILDDACRDVSSSVAGPVRDVALIGAIRKFLAADIVSLETAIALARHEEGAEAAALEAMRQAGAGENRLLGEQLPRLTRR